MPASSALSASSPKDFLEKTDALEDARDALARAIVATAKASPSGDVPPDYKEYEDEYDANTKDFFGKRDYRGGESLL